MIEKDIGSLCEKIICLVSNKIFFFLLNIPFSRLMFQLIFFLVGPFSRFFFSMNMTFYSIPLKKKRGKVPCPLNLNNGEE